MPEPTKQPEGNRAEPKPATGTATVNVACKISNGLILRVYEMQEDYEPVLGGGQRKIDKAFQVGEDVVIHGNVLDPEMFRSRKMPRYEHVGGYAITRGVPKDFWDLWLKQNADQPCVINKLVFGFESLDRVRDVASELEPVESGYEGIDPDNPGKKTGIRGITKGSTVPLGA